MDTHNNNMSFDLVLYDKPVVIDAGSSTDSEANLSAIASDFSAIASKLDTLIKCVQSKNESNELSKNSHICLDASDSESGKHTIEIVLRHDRLNES